MAIPIIIDKLNKGIVDNFAVSTKYDTQRYIATPLIIGKTKLKKDNSTKFPNSTKLPIITTLDNKMFPKINPYTLISGTAQNLYTTNNFKSPPKI